MGENTILGLSSKIGLIFKKPILEYLYDTIRLKELYEFLRFDLASKS